MEIKRKALFLASTLATACVSVLPLVIIMRKKPVFIMIKKYILKNKKII